MLLLSSESKTPNNRTTFSEILTVSVCKSQKRNLSLSSQLNGNLEDKNEENPNESFNLNSANTRKSPMKKKMISDTLFTYDNNFATEECIDENKADSIDPNTIQ